MISFVIPVFNERETLEALCDGIRAQVGARDFEIVFVDDGSDDGSSDTLAGLAAADERVRVFRFEANRGKSAALSRGFLEARGEVVVTMDSDLQDDPAEIPRFLERVEAGCDLVCGWKHDRKDPLSKTVPSRIYNGFVSRLFGVPIHDVNCGFKAMRREVAAGLGELEEGQHRLIPVLVARRGYRVEEITVTHRARRYGKSKYGAARYWHGLRDVLRLWLGR